MNKQEFEQLIGNHIFTATFRKKNGELRTYGSARVNVQKDLVGGSNNQEHCPNLVSVYVLSEGNERKTLNLNTVTHFKCGNKEFRI